MDAISIWNPLFLPILWRALLSLKITMALIACQKCFYTRLYPTRRDIFGAFDALSRACALVGLCCTAPIVSGDPPLFRLVMPEHSWMVISKHSKGHLRCKNNNLLLIKRRNKSRLWWPNGSYRQTTNGWVDSWDSAICVHQRQEIPSKTIYRRK